MPRKLVRTKTSINRSSTKKLNDILNDIKQIGINCGALEKAKSIINTYNSHVKRSKNKT